MTLDEALERAAKLAPSDVQTLYVPSMPGHRCPAVLEREQLMTAEALGLLAAEVRRLGELCAVLKAAREGVQLGLAELDAPRRAKLLEDAGAVHQTVEPDDAAAALRRVEALVSTFEQQRIALLYQGSRFQTAQALAIAGVVQQLKLALEGGEL